MQTPQMGPNGDDPILTNTKEGENPTQKNLGHLNDSTTTPLPNRGRKYQHQNPHGPLVEVSHNPDTGMANVMARHNHSHVHVNINGKEYNFAPGTTQIH